MAISTKYLCAATLQDLKGIVNDIQICNHVISIL